MGNEFITMYNIIKYLLLLITALFDIAECQLFTSGCYRQPTSPCSQHTLACPKTTVIAVDEFPGSIIAYGIKKAGYKCSQDQMGICNASCCKYQGRNEDVTDTIPISHSDRLAIYRNCSHLRTCTVTSPYSPDTDYDYIRYIYTCLSVSRIYNMMEITDVSYIYFGYLYYSGRTQTTGTKITRCCNITSTEPIQVMSVYIYLTEESSYNVKIYSENQTFLSGAAGGGIFYEYAEHFGPVGRIYHVVLDNLTVEEDDYIWIEADSIKNRIANISITCDNCAASDTDINSKIQSTERTSNMVTSTDTNTKISSTEETSTSTGTDTMTSSNNKDHNNGGDVNTGLTVGIIVVCLLLIITWFIVGVYCIRRKMKRTQNSGNEQNIERVVNIVEPEHNYSGLVNRDGPDTGNNIGPELSNKTKHDYTALNFPMRVQTKASSNVDYENTLTNTNDQPSKNSA